jgi:septal ring factor EnvC (AmiA/AmiB activator)
MAWWSADRPDSGRFNGMKVNMGWSSEPEGRWIGMGALGAGRMTAAPLGRGGIRPWVVLMSLMCLVSLAGTGCAWTKDLDEARLQAEECRLELDRLRAQLGSNEDLTRLRAQRDRLTAENQSLKRELGELRRCEQDCRKRLGDAERNGPEFARQLELQRKELEIAAENLRRSRQQWEDALAERQRQIEMLNSRIAGLRKELSARPATRPGS